jgi:hypothetical protein
MKFRNKFQRKSLDVILEELLLKKDVAETTVTAISFLNPEIDEQGALMIYTSTLLSLIPVEELEKFRDDVVSLADKKVKEVSDLYELYGRGN